MSIFQRIQFQWDQDRATSRCIDERRRMLRLSQPELANRLGDSQSTVSRDCRGHHISSILQGALHVPH